MSRVSKEHRKGVNTLIILGAWIIWKHRNACVFQLSVAKMRMLRWIYGHTRMDRVRNDDIRDRLEVASIEEKLVQHSMLRWFGHV